MRNWWSFAEGGSEVVKSETGSIRLKGILGFACGAFRCPKHLIIVLNLHEPPWLLNSTRRMGAHRWAMKAFQPSAYVQQRHQQYAVDTKNMDMQLCDITTSSKKNRVQILQWIAHVKTIDCAQVGRRRRSPRAKHKTLIGGTCLVCPDARKPCS